MSRPALASFLHTAAMTAGVIWDSPLFLLDYALRLLRVIVLLALWRTIFAERQTVGAISLGAILTYTVVAEVFADQLTVKTTLADAFWDGTIAVRFLRPMRLVGQFSAEMLGRWSVNLALFSAPLLVLAPALGVDPRPASPLNAVVFVVSLGLAIVVGLAMDVFFGAFTVALDQPVWLVENTRAAVAALLSGSLLPLAVYPWGLGDVFQWLPFAAMAWAPLAIYTGAAQPLPLLLSQTLWAILLWPAANTLWRLNREKVAGYGG